MTADRLTEIDATTAPIVTAFAYAATVDLVPYLHVAYADRLEREIAAPLRPGDRRSRPRPPGAAATRRGGASRAEALSPQPRRSRVSG